jgi:hypothetical protein
MDGSKLNSYDNILTPYGKKRPVSVASENSNRCCKCLIFLFCFLIIACGASFAIIMVLRDGEDSTVNSEEVIKVIEP